MGFEVARTKRKRKMKTKLEEITAWHRKLTEAEGYETNGEKKKD